jgi:hypothetical protein
MNIIYYVHKSVELLFQIFGLVEVWTHRSMELSPKLLLVVRPFGICTWRFLETISNAPTRHGIIETILEMSNGTEDSQGRCRNN